MDLSELVALFLYILLLSFVAIGGFPTVLPEMQRYIVETHHLMTGEQFAAAYALAQLSPGPNVMYVTLIGWQVAGWSGAAATTLAVLGPVGTFTILVARLRANNPNAPLSRALSRGLTPIALGLYLASALILARSVNHDSRGYLLTVLAVVVVVRTRWNPLWLLAVGALAGMAGLV
jgi:chromate transporter